MQESLHLQITKLIVRQDQPMQMKSFKKKKKQQQTNLLSIQAHVTQCMQGCCAMLYMSVDSMWGEFTLKWNYDRSGLGGKV